MKKHILRNIVLLNKGFAKNLENQCALLMLEHTEILFGRCNR